jgi:uncharacterized membrane protein
MKINKTVILPILAFIQLISASLGHPISDTVVNNSADAIVNIASGAFVIYGIIKDHWKKGE